MTDAHEPIFNGAEDAPEDYDEPLPYALSNIIASLGDDWGHDDRALAVSQAVYDFMGLGAGDFLEHIANFAERNGLHPELVRRAVRHGCGRWARRNDNNLINGHNSQPALITKAVEPLETFDAAEWNGKTPELRRWVTSLQIPCGEPGLLNGDGGTGKTTAALQLANAVADDGIPDWLGKCVEAHGPVIFYTIEEKKQELHRRFANIRASRNLGDMKPGRWHIISDLTDAVLARPEKGILKPTLTLHRLEKTVEKIRPALVIIENAADVFLGSEIDRAQVSMFVRVMLGALCVPSEAAMMLLQHPSVSGLQDGTGRSGSTAWNNAGRWRLNFTFAKDDEESDLRQLKTEKLNYGKRGETFRVKWDNGVFVLAGSQSTPERVAAENAVDSIFLTCLAAKQAQGIHLGPNTGKNYAPAAFEKMPQANGCKSAALATAMERLLAKSAITCTTSGPPSRRVTIFDALRTPLRTP